MIEGAISQSAEDMEPSAAQLAMLAAIDLSEGRQRFNLTECLHLTGALDPDRSRSAFDRLLERHEMLRAGFHRRGEGWRRTVAPRVTGQVTVTDLRDKPEVQRDELLSGIKADFFAKPFDLASPPLVRFHIVTVADQENLLLASIHHLVADGWSIAVLLRHFAEAYRSGRIRRLERDLSYSDWRKDRSIVEPVKAVALGTPPNADNLPADFLAAPGQDAEPTSITSGLSAADVVRLDAEARRAGVTRTAALISPLVRLLRHWSGQTSCTLGIAAANRSGRSHRDTVGLFASVEEMTVEVPDTGPPDLLARRVQDALRGLALPRLAPAVASSQARVSFNYIPWRGDALSIPGLVARREPTPNLFSRNDLAFYVRHDETAGLHIELVYNAARFAEDTARCLLNQYVRALDPSAPDPGPSLLEGSASAPQNADTDAGWIIRRLALHARTRPEHVAIETADIRLTYAQLDRLTDGLADDIQAAGVSSGGRVAIMARRDHCLPLALLAIWKAGGVASVWDSRHPEERLLEFAAQFEPHLILLPEKMSISEALVSIPTRPLPDRIDLWQLGDRSSAVPKAAAAMAQFTSGTTGRPKGVLSGHQALATFIDWQCRTFDVGPEDRVSFLSGLGHDPSLRDILLPLWAGGTLCIPNPSDIENDRISEWLRARAVTIMHATPAMARLAFGRVTDRLAGLREIFFGGDRVTPADVRDCQAKTAATGVVFYGATETPQAVLWHRCKIVSDRQTPIPVGQPVPAASAVVPRSDGRQAEPLQVGELYIGGRQLCLGYLDVPDDPDRFCKLIGQTGRFYRTGDLVRVGADGVLHFVGRMDRQTKVRGFRVEPAEVEAHLRALPGISDACVLDHRDRAGETALAAFVTAKDTPQSIPECGIFFFGDAAPTMGDGLYDFYLEAARLADQAGLSALWTPERHFTAVAGAFPNPALLTAALATTTHRLKLRAGSVVFPLHHPVRIAEDWAVLDRLSGGRAELALASGWLADDFIFAPDLYETRKAALHDGVGVLRQLWAGEGVAFRNGLGQTVDVRIRPLPAARQLPLWLTATSNPETFEMAGRLGCNVLTALNNQSPDELRRNIARLRQAARMAGHVAPRVALMLHSFVAASDADARAKVAPALRDYLRAHADLRRDFVKRMDNSQEMSGADLDGLLDLALERMIAQGVVGSVEHCARRLAELGEMGVDEVAALVDFGLDAASVLPSIQALADAQATARTLVGRVDVAGARRRIAEVLPDYMVPAHLQQVAAIPLTPNGKIDRTALLDSLRAEATETPYAPPLSPDEQVLCAILADLTGRERVGLDDDFFAIGGYSLLALKAIARFGEATGRALPVGALLRNRSVRMIVRALDPAPVATTPQPARSETDPPQTRWPLSIGQQSLLLLDKLGLAPGALNVAATVRLKGPLDVPRLTDSLYRAIDRHPMLQARFVSDDDEVYQILDPARDVEIVDATVNLPAALERLAREPIDRFRCPPLRQRLFRVTETEHVLAIVVHHTASDGESLKILLKEIPDLYAGQVPPTIRERNRHYGRYAQDTPARPLTPDAKAATERAAQALIGAATLLELPCSPQGSSDAAGSLQLHLSAQEVAALRAFTTARGVTPFAVFHAAYVAVLSQYAGMDDVLCGVATAGRPLPWHEGTVGLFANLAVTRSRIGPDATFGGLVAQSASEAERILDLQNVRFEWLLDRVQPERRPHRHPLVQAVLSVQEGEFPAAASLPGPLSIEFSMGENTSAVLYDLLLSVTRTGRNWRLRLDYSGLLFGPDSATGFLRAVRSVLVAGLADLCRPIHDLPLVDEADRPALLGSLAGVEVPLMTACVHDLVLAQARARPEATALLWRNRHLSYAELVDLASRISGALAARGLGKGAVVAISASRSPEVIAALLAVLMVGAAYLPLDPHQPADRYRQLATLAGAGLVLADDLALAPDSLPCPVASLTELLQAGSALRHSEPVPCQGTDTACVLFTSGSTGVPKGVVLPHQGLARLIVQTDYVSITPTDVVLHANTLSFDLSNFDIWGALANGATLALADDARSRLVATSDAIRQYGVTVTLLATGVFHAMAEDMPEAFAGVRQLLVAGDVLSSELCRRILARHPGLEITNGYGPTECSTFATALRLTDAREAEAPVPIGRPIANTTAYVLNRARRLAPIGMPGELYLGGIGVATGYLGRPDLTAERFLPDPFQPGGTLYRTGDIVRWRDDGRGLDFLGRSDHQLKIRGVRVEIGEIVARLLRHPAIVEAVVLPNGEGDRRSLLAFAVAVPGVELADEVLRGWLAETLPQVMIPAEIVLLSAMPLTANGKIDRTALLDQHSSRPAERPKADRPPTAVEGVIGEIFAALLNVPKVGPQDNFFNLGGNSLTGLRVVARIRKLFAMELPLGVIMANPTPAAIAAHLVRAEVQPGRTEAIVRALATLRARRRNGNETTVPAEGAEPTAPIT